MSAKDTANAHVGVDGDAHTSATSTTTGRTRQTAAYSSMQQVMSDLS